MVPGQPLYRVKVSSGVIERVTDFQNEMDTGVSRCVFIALTPNNLSLTLTEWPTFAEQLYRSRERFQQSRTGTPLARALSLIREYHPESL